MKRFVEGVDRGQSTLFPASLDDYVAEEKPPHIVVDGRACRQAPHCLERVVLSQFVGLRIPTVAS
jgi:hypothetical protein